MNKFKYHLRKNLLKINRLPEKLYTIYNMESPEPDARDKYLEDLELYYLFSIFNLFNKVENTPGHIVELGVGGGRNAILFGKLLKATNQNLNANYYGFDSFGSYTKKDLAKHSTLDPKRWERNSKQFVEERIHSHDLSDTCHLIEGDIRETIPDFLKRDDFYGFSSSGFFCRLIYVDTSAYAPSLLSMEKLYEHLSIGGILSIDQRKQGGEWSAFNEFCSKKCLKPIAGKNLNDAPAYIIKE